MDLVSYFISGYRCDATGCEAEVSGPPLPSGTDNYRQMAEAQGWTFYASRGKRAYCPEHGPRPGHRMRRITTDAAASRT